MKVKKVIELILFNIKWVLPIFYFILSLSLIAYAYVDIKEFVEYVSHMRTLDKNASMLTLIELIDLTMIANLAKMIITGSYNSFISKDHGHKSDKISSGLLKVKMSTSLVGVTGIALLQRAVKVNKLDELTVSWDTLYKLGFIHGFFLLGSIVLIWVDHLHEKTELNREKFERKYKINEDEQH